MEEQILAPQPSLINIPLYPHQLKSIENMTELEKTGQIISSSTNYVNTKLGVLGDIPGHGKCSKIDTPILMFSGEIKMVQNIEVGDLLMGDDSQPRKVLSTTKGRGEMFKIKQKNGGEDYTVNINHVLSLKMSVPKFLCKNVYGKRVQVFYFVPETLGYKSKTFSYSSFNSHEKTIEAAEEFMNNLEINQYVDVQLEDFMKLPTRIKRHLKGYRVGVEFGVTPVEIDPYFVGLWLGDGNSDGPCITNIDQEIIDYLYREFPDFDILRSREKLSKNYLSPKINKGKQGSNRILEFLKSSGILNNKHIPVSYKINSRDNRLKLLAGLIDSDGYYSCGCYEISQKNTILANDIVFLCRSLGFRTTVKKVNKYCMYKGEKRWGEYNLISFSGFRIDQIPCLLGRKKSTTCTPNKDQMCCEIEVEPMGTDDYYGFTLDGNHRYLHGDFTVTHNSLSILGMTANTLNDPIDPLYFDEDIKTFKYVSSVKVNQLEQTRCSLIMVNVSLLSQWIFELNRTLLKFKAVYTKNDIENIPLDDFDVILVANNIYNLFALVYRRKSWKRFVIDEPMSLKLHSPMETTNAKFYWFVTATPLELYSKRRTGFMDDLLPDDLGLFNQLILKNNDEFVKSSYDMPPTHYIRHNCSENIGTLFEGLAPLNIIEMIEAGAFGLVLDNFNSQEDEKLIIGAYRQRKNKRIEDLKKETPTTPTIVEKIQTIESHLKILDERIQKYVSDNTCNLCGQPYSGEGIHVLSCCQNFFCGCVSFSPCKLCKSVETEGVFLQNRVSGVPAPRVGTPLTIKNKIATLLDITTGLENKKILIFSNFNETFSVIKKFLEEKQMSYLELKGTKEKRDNTIDLYKSGNINILLLNTILSGAGLNLPETTDVVLYHRVRQYQEIQVVGRANRIGRKTELSVHQL